MKPKLTKAEIICICHTISKFGESAEKQAAKQAILQTDFTQYESMQEFTDLISKHMTTKTIGRRQDRNRYRNTNNDSTPNLANVTTGSRKVKCKACEGSHYLADCKNEGKKAELKRRDPDTYKKFINPPKCKFGANCKKEGCKFLHPSDPVHTTTEMCMMITNKEQVNQTD